MPTDDGRLVYTCGDGSIQIVTENWAPNETSGNTIYNCGERQGAYLVKSSGRTSRKRVTFSMMFFLLFPLFFGAGWADAPEAAGFSNFAKLVELEEQPGDVYNITQHVKVDNDLLVALTKANALLHIKKFTSAVYEFVGANETDIEGAMNEMPFGRICQPISPVSSIREWQVAQSGTWWSPRYPVSRCHWCQINAQTCSISLGYSFTYTWSASGDISFKTLAASINVAVSKSETRDESFVCNWNGPNGPRKIWYQQEVYWVDMQRRDRIIGSNCSLVTPWSQYFRVDAPIRKHQLIGCIISQKNFRCKL